MGIKLSRVAERDDLFTFECPGCGLCHYLDIKRWKFNGNMEAPSAQPSLLVRATFGEEHTPYVCHFFITNGVLEFCSDSTHANAGKSMPMLDAD